jgi:CheY-like chemotaxis protein
MALEAKQLETIGRLSAGVAHDFNNDLTAIMGAAQLLKRELPEVAEGRELADDILHAAKHSAELTRQLLAYARKAQMQKAPTDLHALITEALSLLRHSVGPNFRITVDLGAANAVIVADAALMQSAILNLFVNAADAMPDGGTLTVRTASLTQRDEAGGPDEPGVLVEIRDTGHGIEHAVLPEIFNPFFTTKPAGKGTGLGLAAVAGTIKAHGGTIDVRSDVGMGTVFSIRLPVVTETPKSVAHEESDVVRGRGVVLLVDDDAMVGATASATLRSFGYDVVHAPGGAAALELFRASPDKFGLVMLDLRMPGMSGEETFDALRDVDPQVPVVLWSGYGAEQDVAGMLERGAVAFVQKPYRAAELSRVVARSMRARRAS